MSGGLYLQQHRNLIEERFNIPFMHLEKGMIVEMYYRSLDKNDPEGKRLLSPEYYIFLILQKRWPNNASGYTHAISLEHITPFNFNKFANKCGIKYSYYQKKLRRLDIKKLEKLEEKTSKRFYNEDLKILLHNSFEGSYRTLFPTHWTYFRAVNYKFKLNKQVLNDNKLTKENIDKNKIESENRTNSSLVSKDNQIIMPPKNPGDI